MANIGSLYAWISQIISYKFCLFHGSYWCNLLVASTRRMWWLYDLLHKTKRTIQGSSFWRNCYFTTFRRQKAYSCLVKILGSQWRSRRVKVLNALYKYLCNISILLELFSPTSYCFYFTRCQLGFEFRNILYCLFYPFFRNKYLEFFMRSERTFSTDSSWNADTKNVYQACPLQQTRRNVSCRIFLLDRIADLFWNSHTKG